MEKPELEKLFQWKLKVLDHPHDKDTVKGLVKAIWKDVTNKRKRQMVKGGRKRESESVEESVDSEISDDGEEYWNEPQRPVEKDSLEDGIEIEEDDAWFGQAHEREKEQQEELGVIPSIQHNDRTTKPETPGRRTPKRTSPHPIPSRSLEPQPAPHKAMSASPTQQRQHLNHRHPYDEHERHVSDSQPVPRRKSLSDREVPSPPITRYSNPVPHSVPRSGAHALYPEPTGEGLTLQEFKAVCLGHPLLFSLIGS